jgi:hypothetical protein
MALMEIMGKYLFTGKTFMTGVAARLHKRQALKNRYGYRNN